MLRKRPWEVDLGTGATVSVSTSIGGPQAAGGSSNVGRQATAFDVEPASSPGSPQVSRLTRTPAVAILQWAI